MTCAGIPYVQYGKTTIGNAAHAGFYLLLKFESSFVRDLQSLISGLFYCEIALFPSCSAKSQKASLIAE